MITEKEAKEKLCPMTSSVGGMMDCEGSKCMLWGWENEQYSWCDTCETYSFQDCVSIGHKVIRKGYCRLGGQ